LTADHLIIIGKGRLLSSGPVAEFIERSGGHHVKVVTPDADALARVLRAKGATVTAAGPQELSVQGLESRDVGILASGAGLTLYELSTQRASLEDAFMELTHEHAEYLTANGSPEAIPT
jgi:ABC-2 type transport system ATP-binding protein